MDEKREREGSFFFFLFVVFSLGLEAIISFLHGARLLAFWWTLLARKGMQAVEGRCASPKKWGDGGRERIKIERRKKGQGC